MKLISDDGNTIYDEHDIERVIYLTTDKKARDEIIRRVNAHDTLKNTLALTHKTLEALRPVLSPDTSDVGIELIQLIDHVIGEARSALAAASETSTEAAQSQTTPIQGKDTQ